jgi:hypothetical protein
VHAVACRPRAAVVIDSIVVISGPPCHGRSRQTAALSRRWVMGYVMLSWRR